MRASRIVGSFLFALLSIPLTAASGNASIIIDDSDGGPQFTTIGSWNERDEASKPNSYDDSGSRFAFHDTDPVAVATYTPDIPWAGLWQVDLYWPDFSWTDNALVEAAHAGGNWSNRIDQRNNGNDQWHEIGLFEFEEGTAGTLSISSEGTNPGYVGVGPVADAAQFTYLGGVIQPTAAAASSQINSIRGAQHAIDGSGMSDENGDGFFDTHVYSVWGDDNSWMSDWDDTKGWYAVDLGEEYWLEEMELYNFNVTSGNNTRGVKTADIYVSTLEDPGIASPDFSDASVWTLFSDDHAFTIAPGDSPCNTPDVVDFEGQAIRWVALDIIENHGHGTFTGISEVQFFGTAVPEPASGGLALLGALGLGLLRPRRRSAVAHNTT